MRKSLTSEQYEFLQAVDEAAFTNPFGNRRDQIEKDLSRLTDGLSGKELREYMSDLLAKLLDEVFAGCESSITSFDGVERALLKNACLFSVFLRFRGGIDDFIRRQLAHGDENLTLEIGDEILSELTRFGFREDVAVRYVGIFFQLRRAYHFIRDTLVGGSPCVARLRSHVWENVCTNDPKLFDEVLWDRMEDFSTLLLGDSGTGKGSVASCIGRSGYIPYDRKKRCFDQSFNQSFFEVNLSQFAESLLESELFGHKKGAFTGATEARTGVLGQVGPHNVIFLDEIGEVSEPLQVKLLRVLQERVYFPVGSVKKSRFFGRVVAATNQNIDRLRESGRLREDFYYRLCTDIIEIPTLRQRIAEHPSELGLLIENRVSQILGEELPDIVQSVKDRIHEVVPKNYDWPGNVRELEQCIRRILLTGRYDVRVHGGSKDENLLQLSGMKITAQELLSHYCRDLYRELGSYEAVAEVVDLDRRTVKRHIDYAKD